MKTTKKDDHHKVFKAILEAVNKHGKTTPKQLSVSIMRHLKGKELSFLSDTSLLSEEEEMDAAITMTKLAMDVVNTPPPSPPRHCVDGTFRQRRHSWPMNDRNASQYTIGQTKSHLRYQMTTSTFKDHQYTITTVWIDQMTFYQLDSPDDIPDTKIMRFISGDSEDIVESLPKKLHVFLQHSSNQCQLKDGYVNATQLRKAAIPVLGEGEFEYSTEQQYIEISTGSPLIQGVWIPLERARDLIEEFEIESSPGLTKLLSDDPYKRELDPVIPEIKSKPNTPKPPRKHTKIAPLIIDDKKPTPNPSFETYLFQQALLLNSIISNEPPQPSVIYPIEPTTPPMSISVIDQISICTAVFNEHKIMRRLDNDYINGTQLLIAGGIETESERSMILSFELNRVRMPNKSSSLFGTWIPYKRAQELAATCSIQHKLGPFLNDDIQLLFPSSSLISSNKKNKVVVKNEAVVEDHHLAAITLAALSQSHQHHLQTAPLFGSFLQSSDRHVTIIDSSVQHQQIDDSDEDTDTDNEVEQVRKKMKKLRDDAIAAMEIGNIEPAVVEVKRDISHHYVQQPSRKRRPGGGGKWSSNNRPTPIQRSVTWNGSSLNRPPSNRPPVIVKPVISKPIEKKKAVKPLITQMVVNEEDEDEDVDIGGSDHDDDLR